MGEEDILGLDCVGHFAADRFGWECHWRDSPLDRGRGNPLKAVETCRIRLLERYGGGGIIGYVAFEYGYSVLGLPEPEREDERPAEPLVQFLLFSRLVHSRSRPREATHRWRSFSTERDGERNGWRRLMSRDQYVRAIWQIKRHIADGDIYQANFTQPFETESARSGWDVFRAYSTINPAPFSGFLRFPPLVMTSAAGERPIAGIEIMSCSPERFWRKRGQFVETRPIKGTIGRGCNPAEDRERLRRLLTSKKDAAELLMITDLERNDLGKIAVPGSVRVTGLRRPRAYASVWHLESTVECRIQKQADWTDVMTALFPGGSVTGAPKRRAVAILAQLEPVPRGVYCGAIGWVDAVGDADFSIAIRTAVKTGSKVRVFGGGGIVADSDPDAEYEESLIKIAPMLNAQFGKEAEVSDPPHAVTLAG